MPLTIKRCHIDGRSVTSVDDVYESLSRQLDLPLHFGRNLDALWDVLTADLPGPAEIIWDNAALSRLSLGDMAERLQHLLREASGERSDLTVTISD